MPDEDSLRHKYAPLPDEPQFKKKKPKKPRVRSNHKHVYETVCVDDHSRMYRDGRKIPYMNFVKRCKVCGRIGDVKIKAGVHEPPGDMSFYVVPSWMYLWTEKTLSEEMRVR